MRQFYFVAGLILGLAIAIFALQNTAPVEVRFLAWQVRGSLAAVVLASAGAGLLVALLFVIPEILAARWRIRGLEHRLAAEAREGQGAAEAPPDDQGRRTAGGVSGSGHRP